MMNIEHHLFTPYGVRISIIITILPLGRSIFMNKYGLSSPNISNKFTARCFARLFTELGASSLSSRTYMFRMKFSNTYPG